MKRQAQQETRGRKRNFRPIGKNGLYVDQWERIMTDANAKGYGSGIVLLRQIVQKHYDEIDLEREREIYSDTDAVSKLPIQKPIKEK